MRENVGERECVEKERVQAELRGNIRVEREYWPTKQSLWYLLKLQ